MVDEQFWKYLKKIQHLQSKALYFPDEFVKYLGSYYYDRNEIPEGPIYATWDVTKRCNLNCFFCSADAKRILDKQELNTADKIRVAERLVEWGINYVSLRGGEPSLCKELMDVIETLVRGGVYTEVVSNGTGINSEFCSRLSMLPKHMYRVKISLDSPNISVNDEQRGKNSFKFATKALTNLMKFEINNVRVQTVITEYNKFQLFDMYKYIHEFNVYSFGFALLLPSGRSSKFNPPVLEKSILKQFILMKNMEKSINKIKVEKIHFGYMQNVEGSDSCFDSDLSDNDANKIFRMKCNAAVTRINVDSNGDIYPCDFLKFPEFKSGNIIQDDLYKVWHSAIFSRLRNITRFDKKECNKCIRRSCTTGCMGLAFNRYHSLLRKDPNCEVK